MDHNSSTLVGRLSKNPEFHPAGRRGEAHCTFTVASNRVVANEKGPAADYIPVSFWGPEAQKFCEIVGKGDTVFVRGRIRTGFVEQPGGGSRFFWEVRAEEVQTGMRCLKNLQAKPAETRETRAVDQLMTEFGSQD